MLPEFVSLSDGIENDMVQGRQFHFPRGSIVAFDKGYVDYQWFGALTTQGVYFVTRLRPKAVYSVLEEREILLSKGVLRDQVIQLDSAHALKRGAPKLRRIEFKDKESGKDFIFLTNHFHLAASTIAAKTGWTVQRIMRVIQLNLFERKSLQEILQPDPRRLKRNEPQMRLIT